MVQSHAGDQAVGRRAAQLILGVDTVVSDDLVSIMRMLFFRFLVFTSVFSLPMLATGEAPVRWRIAGGIALVGLVAWWSTGGGVAGSRRGRLCRSAWHC